ncbi:MAG: peptidylprolyl isomerase [Planctomycetota bacterium]
MIDLETADLTGLEAVMETDKGAMVIGFYPEQAPGHVKNFLSLAQKGFYDGLAFHRVIRNFMVQCGCPNTREGANGIPGTGDAGYKIEAEFNDLPHQRGVLSMARGPDPDSAGSQFFVVHAEHAQHLDGQYTAFGFVKEGLDVLDAIASAEVDFGDGGERSRPAERIGVATVAVREAVPAPAGEGEGETASGGPEEA